MLIRMAQIKGVFGARIAVDAGEEDVGPVIKDGLGAIAVVVIHIQHCHFLYTRIAQLLGGQRRVVKKAVAAKEIHARVVARRAAERKGGAVTTDDLLRRAERAVRPSACRHPGTTGEWRARVVRIQTHFGRKVIRLNVCTKSTCGPRRRKNVLVHMARIQRHPLVPSGGQKVQVAGAVDAGQQAVVEGVRGLNGAQLAALQLGQHMVSAGWHFKTRHQRAAEHLDLALVLGVQVVVKSNHE